MAQIGRFRNPPGLRLNVDSRPGTPYSVHGGSNNNDNWCEDLVRIVGQNRPQSKFLISDEPSVDDTVNTEVKLKPNDFEMVEKLGEGSAGIVWKVRYKPTGRTMAKKAITVEAEPLKRRQIIRELSFLKTCESPCIVSFYGAFLDGKESTISICMEYCEGGSFEDIYKRARDLRCIISEHVLASLADSVCQALIYLHSKKVIHRDIKPSNILVCKSGEIKLCDLGVSGELIDSIAETFTGTQYYMAPERIQGSAYSVKSDIWSLGLTIIEVAQKKPALPPSDHPHLSVFELLDFIVSQPLPTLGLDRSEESRDFVTRCLIKSPQDRPGPAEMLKHSFLKVPRQNISSWIKEIWHWK